jgi:hypothetical protein
VKARRHGNSITSLVNDRGDHLTSFQEIAAEASQYFATLFREESQGDSATEAQVISCFPHLVSREANEKLMNDVTLEELEGIVFQIKRGKAPGPDGFPIEFFQEFWEIIKWDLLLVV